MRFNPIRVLAIVALIGLLLAALFWLCVGRSIPGRRAQLFKTPLSNIRCIEIKPDPIFSLVKQSLVVTNKTEIKDIMTAIRSARPYEPQHPGTRWACTLVISNSLGNSYVEVNDTRHGQYSQGTILDCTTSEEGLIYNTLRSDTLGDILEKVAHNNGDDLADAGWRNDKPPTRREMIFGLSLFYAAICFQATISLILVALGIIYLFIRKKRLRN